MQLYNSDRVGEGSSGICSDILAAQRKERMKYSKNWTSETEENFDMILSAFVQLESLVV